MKFLYTSSCSFFLLLRLSYRIPLITGILLILTAIVNIAAFQVFSEKYFTEYLSAIKENDTPDPDRIRALLQIGKLAPEDQAEYATILAELSNLSTSIENITKNPELYMSEKGASGDAMFSLPKVTIPTQTVVPIFHFSAFGKSSKEGRFVTQVIRDMILFNLLWLTLILFAYFVWIRSIFRPIGIVTETIRNIIDGRRYGGIRYNEKNEFRPLIDTINSLNKSLAIQEKIRSDFLADVSHEIRTPITAVKCYLEAIEDGMMKLDPETIPLLQSELTRLTDITSRIMEYESLTSETFGRVQVEKFHLRKTTEEVLRSYTPQLQKNLQRVQLQFPKDTMTQMDHDMYIQILHNMFSNFLKYAGSGSELIVTYEKHDREYIITFADNGIGIPDSELEFVREKFYRVNKARTQSDKSMGIGLSIIDRIARLHRGSLTIEKNHPTGVRFIVRVGR